jgi:hypothetical protein
LPGARPSWNGGSPKSPKAAADKLQDIRFQGEELKITPLKAATPEEAEDLADRLYAMMSTVRITALAEVDRWTGFSGAIATHWPQSSVPSNSMRLQRCSARPTCPALTVSTSRPRAASEAPTFRAIADSLNHVVSP